MATERRLKLLALTLALTAARLAEAAPKPAARMAQPPPLPPQGQPGNVQWLVQIYLQQQQAQQQQQRSPSPKRSNSPPPEPDYPGFDPWADPPTNSPPPANQFESPPPPTQSPSPPSPNRFPPPATPSPPPPSPPPPRALPNFMTFPSPPPPVEVASLESNPPLPSRQPPSPPPPPTPRVLMVLSPPPPPGSGYFQWANLPSIQEQLPPSPPPPPPSPICSPPPPPLSPMDIWIVAGQSNAVGFNDLDYTPMPMPCGASMPGQMLMYPMSSHTWVDAHTCVGAISCGNPDMTDAIGPDMPFARALISMGISNRIGLIPTAVGGTSLAFSWRYPDGPQWQDMVSTVQYAMAAAGPQAKLRGMLWVQGETDGMNYDGAGPYYLNLQKFVWALRNFTLPYHSRLPIVTALMATQNRDLQYPYIGWIREAQQYPNPDTPDIVKVDMEGLEFFYQDMGFGPQWTHLTKKGACDLGTNMAQAWAASGLQSTR